MPKTYDQMTLVEWAQAMNEKLNQMEERAVGIQALLREMTAEQAAVSA